METLNLDKLCPESMEVVHKGKAYLLEPMSTERLLEIVPIWEKYSDVDKKDLKEQLALSTEFLGQILPDFPGNDLKKLTVWQLRAFMEAVMKTMGLEEIEDEGKGDEGPKEDKS